LIGLQKESSDASGSAKLKSEDSKEALNEELVNQMELMKEENERLKAHFENETDVLREELQECEQFRAESEQQVGDNISFRNIFFNELKFADSNVQQDLQQRENRCSL
jgi:DNA mismatch repair ATPase MutS